MPTQFTMDTSQENYIYQLKERQDAIARMIALGATDKEISEALNISVFTVRSEINTIMETLNAKNRAHIAYFVGLRQGREWLPENDKNPPNGPRQR